MVCLVPQLREGTSTPAFAYPFPQYFSNNSVGRMACDVVRMPNRHHHGGTKARIGNIILAGDPLDLQRRILRRRSESC